MITDKEMIDLGFRKEKTYDKKVIGVSKYCWMYKHMIMLTIERDLASDFSNKFQPTLRLFRYIIRFEDINKVKIFLEVIGVYDKFGS